LFDEELQEVADKFVAVAKNPETETVELVFNLNETLTWLHCSKIYRRPSFIR
jgi:hypothetical protein